MSNQPGILTFGTAHHAYLEFDLTVDPSLDVLRSVVGAVDRNATTAAGVMAVVAFRPELWAKLVPEQADAQLTGFNEPIVGLEDFTMPATQHDVAVWLHSGSQDAVFDFGSAVLKELRDIAAIGDETIGWAYRQNRDLTGFADGTENPHLSEVSETITIPDGPAAGGSVLLLQRWPHDVKAWDSLSVSAQEKVIGRTKSDDVEMSPKPPSSHAARTDQEDFGTIVRRNTAYGAFSDHGTFFIGFSATKQILQTMLENMAGLDGMRDALTYFSHADTGAYYFVPSVEQLDPFRPDLDDEDED